MPTREQMIEALIEDWLESIANAGGQVVTQILREGFKGYDHMTDDEVRKDYVDQRLHELFSEDE